jgi:hypothetical protein
MSKDLEFPPEHQQAPAVRALDRLVRSIQTKDGANGFDAKALQDVCDEVKELLDLEAALSKPIALPDDSTPHVETLVRVRNIISGWNNDDDIIDAVRVIDAALKQPTLKQ